MTSTSQKRLRTTAWTSKAAFAVRKCGNAENTGEKAGEIRKIFLSTLLFCAILQTLQKNTHADFSDGAQAGNPDGLGKNKTCGSTKPMEERNMSVISMKQLLEAGVHFGHQTRRWNPKMAPYIYTERNGIYIIDLQKSVGMVDDAYNAVSDIAAEGGTILFVGTKKQAQDAIKTEAERCGMFYVNLRYVLCKREMAGRYAHKLQDDPEPCKTSQRDRGNVRGRNIRCTSEEGSYRSEKRVG